jgi:hypothetical protein
MIPERLMYVVHAVNRHRDPAASLKWAMEVGPPRNDVDLSRVHHAFFAWMLTEVVRTSENAVAVEGVARLHLAASRGETIAKTDWNAADNVAFDASTRIPRPSDVWACAAACSSACATVDYAPKLATAYAVAYAVESNGGCPAIVAESMAAKLKELIEAALLESRERSS